jgi:hypothetical protein
MSMISPSSNMARSSGLAQLRERTTRTNAG